MSIASAIGFVSARVEHRRMTHDEFVQFMSAFDGDLSVQFYINDQPAILTEINGEHGELRLSVAVSQ